MVLAAYSIPTTYTEILLRMRSNLPKPRDIKVHIPEDYNLDNARRAGSTHLLDSSLQLVGHHSRLNRESLFQKLPDHLRGGSVSSIYTINLLGDQLNEFMIAELGIDTNDNPTIGKWFGDSACTSWRRHVFIIGLSGSVGIHDSPLHSSIDEQSSTGYAIQYLMQKINDPNVHLFYHDNDSDYNKERRDKLAKLVTDVIDEAVGDIHGIEFVEKVGNLNTLHDMLNNLHDRLKDRDDKAIRFTHSGNERLWGEGAEQDSTIYTKPFDELPIAQKEIYLLMILTGINIRRERNLLNTDMNRWLTQVCLIKPEKAMNKDYLLPIHSYNHLTPNATKENFKEAYLSLPQDPSLSDRDNQYTNCLALLAQSLCEIRTPQYRSNRFITKEESISWWLEGAFTVLDSSNIETKKLTDIALKAYKDCLGNEPTQEINHLDDFDKLLMSIQDAVSDEFGIDSSVYKDNAILIAMGLLCGLTESKKPKRVQGRAGQLSQFEDDLNRSTMGDILGYVDFL